MGGGSSVDTAHSIIFFVKLRYRWCGAQSDLEKTIAEGM